MVGDLFLRPVVERLLDKAEAFHHSGNRSLTYVYFRAAVASDETAVSQIRWGEALMRDGRTDEAISRLVSALELSKRLNDASGQSYCCFLLSSLHDSRGESDSAARFEQMSLRAAMDALEDGLPYTQFPEIFSVEEPNYRTVDPDQITPEWAAGVRRTALALKAYAPTVSLELISSSWRVELSCQNRTGEKKNLESMCEILCANGHWQSGMRLYRLARNLDTGLPNDVPPGGRSILTSHSTAIGVFSCN